MAIKVADFITHIGFDIDDSALKQVQAKVKEATLAAQGIVNEKLKAKAIRGPSTAPGKDDIAMAIRRRKAEQAQDLWLYKERSRQEQQAARERMRLRKLEQEQQYKLWKMQNKQQARPRMGGMFGGLGSMASTALGGYGLFSVGQGIFDAAQLKTQTMAALTATTGGVEQAKQQFKFLNDEVDRLHLNLKTASKGFITLKGSAMGSTMPAEDVNKLFSATNEILTVYGATADDVQGTFRALGQMMSKQTVMSEELKGQLSERVYGAISLAAQSLGMSVQELFDKMKKGDVQATELLPKLADTFSKIAHANGALTKSLTSPQAKLNDLQTAWNRFLGRAAESGAMDLIIRLFERLEKILIKLEPHIPALIKVMDTLFTVVEKVADVFFVLVDAIEKTIGLENFIYLIFGAKMVGMISNATGGIMGLAEAFNMARGAAVSASTVFANAGLLGGAALAGYGAGSLIYNALDTQIADVLDWMFREEDPRITNLTKATPINRAYRPQPTPAAQTGPQQVSVKLIMDENMNFKQKVEQVADSRISNTFVLAAASTPGGTR